MFLDFLRRLPSLVLIVVTIAAVEVALWGTTPRPHLHADATNNTFSDSVHSATLQSLYSEAMARSICSVKPLNRLAQRCKRHPDPIPKSLFDAYYPQFLDLQAKYLDSLVEQARERYWLSLAIFTATKEAALLLDSMEALGGGAQDLRADVMATVDSADVAIAKLVGLNTDIGSLVEGTLALWSLHAHLLMPISQDPESGHTSDIPYLLIFRLDVEMILSNIIWSTYNLFTLPMSGLLQEGELVLASLGDLAMPLDRLVNATLAYCGPSSTRSLSEPLTPHRPAGCRQLTGSIDLALKKMKKGINGVLGILLIVDELESFTSGMTEAFRVDDTKNNTDIPLQDVIGGILDRSTTLHATYLDLRELASKYKFLTTASSYP